jgi:hypothetical protein
METNSLNANSSLPWIAMVSTHGYVAAIPLLRLPGTADQPGIFST